MCKKIVFLFLFTIHPLFIVSNPVDSLFINNIRRMEIILDGNFSKEITNNFPNRFFEMFSFLSDYHILRPHCRNFLFQADVEYIKHWYQIYGKNVQWGMIDTIYSFLNAQPFIDLSDEEYEKAWIDFEEKIKSYKIIIYGAPSM